MAGTLSLGWAIAGAVGFVIGCIYQVPWVMLIGAFGMGIMAWYIWRSTRNHKGFEKAFGADWSKQITPQQTKHMTQKRWTWFLKMKTHPEPLWERDLAFWIIPNTERKLLCDIWRPINGNVSGLAIIYFHGSAWFVGDKDFATRPLFHHLVAQGHTVMDVAYRLCPEVDIFGMMGDVKRAIAWMKTNASRYGISADKIVLGGGSAGCHLALLAAYAPKQPEFSPEDVKDADMSVCGVFSYYGPTDLLAIYQYENQQRFISLPSIPIGKKPDSIKKFPDADTSRLDVLLGGHPQDVPELYKLASPINHIHPGCPPTLLMQGDQDMIVPVDATNAFYTKLVDSGVPAINVVFPRTNHGFDLFLPQISPTAQSALFDLDRFLAILVNRD